MTQNISGLGLKIRLIASFTYPLGIDITQLADDSNPFDLPSMQIQDKAMGVNGDLLVWSKANPIVFNLAVTPGTSQDSDNQKLQTLFNNNRAAQGKLPIHDIITLVGIFEEGNICTLEQGAITDGKPGFTVSSEGRLETMVYSFVFQNTTGVN